MAAPLASDVTLTTIRKTYGDVVAVDSIDLEIARGEFFTMLGPSGSGKTTTLRIIAGFERPEWFVEQQYPRAVDERAGERHPLALAA